MCHPPSIISSHTPDPDLVDGLRVQSGPSVRVYETQVMVIQLHDQLSALQSFHSFRAAQGVMVSGFRYKVPSQM